MSDADNLRTITADCIICGAKFAMTDSDRKALLEAYQQWDARHKHQEPSDTAAPKRWLL